MMGTHGKSSLSPITTLDHRDPLNMMRIKLKGVAQAVAGDLSEDTLRFQFETQARSMGRYKTIGDIRNSNENSMSSDEAISFIQDDDLHRGLLKPRDADHTLGIGALLSPRVMLNTVKEAPTSSSSKKHNMHDHRRSRSHKVPSDRSTTLSTKLTGGRRLQGDDASSKVAGRSTEVAQDDTDLSRASFSRTIPNLDWRSGPITAPMDGIPTPVSSPNESTTRPKSHSGQTPRKEEQYSMMFAKA